MAGGHTHARNAGAALGIGIVALGASFVVAPPIEGQGWGSGVFRAGIAAGLVLGLLFGPDLDADGITHDEARWKRVPLVGPILYLIVIEVWMPYAVLMPHRGPFSHGVLIGTAGRMVYLALLVYAVWRVWVWTLVPPWVLLGVFAGWAIQDVLHLLAD